MAEAFVAAHEKGIFHRDLKSANAMITAGDKMDFGLAKAFSLLTELARC